MRRLWLTTERLSHFFFFSPPSSIPHFNQGPVQDKQCLPTLQFKQRGPLRPKRWFLNVHWQVGLICVLSRWSLTYIYLPYSGVHTSLLLFLHLCETSWCFLYEKHTGPPQILLSGLYMPCCVKGEDRSRRWGLKWNLQQLLQTKDHDWGLRWCSCFYSIQISSTVRVRWDRYSIVAAAWNPVIVWSVVNSWEILLLLLRPRLTEFKWLNC